MLQSMDTQKIMIHFITQEEERKKIGRDRMGWERDSKKDLHRVRLVVCQRIIWLIYSRFAHPDNWIKGLISTSGQPKFIWCSEGVLKFNFN